MTSKRLWVLILSSLTLLTLSIGWGVNRYLINERIAFVSERLLLLSNLRREALERYFATAETELRFWSSNHKLVEQQLYINDAWNDAVAEGRDPEQRLKLFYVENNPFPLGQRREFDTAGDGSGYTALHAKLHPLAKAFVVERGYYDLFLISPTGDIHYTVEKEADYATNLYTGDYKDTGLADVFKRALTYADTDDVAISDLHIYAPSGDVPAMFMAKAMYGASGELAGVIALQMPINEIAEIMSFHGGMRNTGETYLVGEDLMMRSNSRFAASSTILSQEVDTSTVRKALQGEYGVEFTEDYRGIEVLSAYTSTPIDEFTWAVVAEIDRAEILEIATSERPMLAGIMLFFYSLGIWSAWYLQRSGEYTQTTGLLADLGLDEVDLSNA